jgi:hypothetical protein
MDFLNHRAGGWFSIRFSSFLIDSVQYEQRNCKKLCEFEMKSQGNDVEATVNSKEENT